MAITFVSAASSYSASVIKTVTANNLVIFMASGTPAAWGTPVSSGAGTTGSWTAVDEATNVGNVTAKMWWAKVTGSGSLTVTISGPGDLGCSIHEYSGADTTSPIDTNGNATGTSVDAGLTLNGVDNGSVVVGIAACESPSTMTADSPYTQQTYESTHVHATLDYIVPSAGSYSPNMSLGTSTSWAFVGAAFLVSGAPAWAGPTFKAAGTFTAGQSSITPPYPTGGDAPVSGDIAILVVESENQAITLTTANGFAEQGEQANKNAGTAATDPASR